MRVFIVPAWRLLTAVAEFRRREGGQTSDYPAVVTSERLGWSVEEVCRRLFIYVSLSNMPI
jgi:hypothetical protein